MIIGKSGASGIGWSELKDIECHKRYYYIKADAIANFGKPRAATKHDEAFQRGTFMHAARAKWLELNQKNDTETLKQCYEAGAEDCSKQDLPCTELTKLEYSLLFTSYANYWAIRPLLKPYAAELFLEHTFTPKGLLNNKHDDAFKRSTRLDDVSFYPDVGGYCIGEFKNTYDLSGALKFYSDFNPQILLQQTIYMKAHGTHPDIKGTMVDIWDNGKQRGTRHFIPINDRKLAQFDRWLGEVLWTRHKLLHMGMPADRNMMVCNTFNDAYKSQCAYKERCMADND